MRLPGEVKKQYRMLAGKPLLVRTIEPFLEISGISEIIVSLPEEDMDYFRSLAQEYLKPAASSPVIRYCEGGSQRQDSVFNALKQCPTDTKRVLVHDGVRPFVSPDKIKALLELCAEYGAAIPGAPVKNTIKTIKEDIVDHTIKRDILIQVYTPQVFDYNILMKCFHRAMLEEYYATDDAALLEHYGYSVHYLTDASHNLKVTDEFDFWLAEQLLNKNTKTTTDKEN